MSLLLPNLQRRKEAHMRGKTDPQVLKKRLEQKEAAENAQLMQLASARAAQSRALQPGHPPPPPFGMYNPLSSNPLPPPPPPPLPVSSIPASSTANPAPPKAKGGWTRIQ